MTIAIGIILIVIVGLVIFGYNMNKKRSATKDDAMRSGQEVREDPRK